jgi:endonuclease/exonuclease/phosphatase family metal-dependent hydrolase
MTQSLQPIVVNRQPRELRKSLKVVTFNAKGGRFLPGILTCLRRSPLADADIILLCDVDWRRKRSCGREVASELATALEMSFAYVPKKIYSRGPDSFAGNAILCSQPLTRVSAVPLVDRRLLKDGCESSFVPRGVLASATFNRRRIALGVVHLAARCSPAGRGQQMADLIASLPDCGPALIGGDFNTTTVDMNGRIALLDAIGKSILHPSRFRTPETHEPLFKHLREAGFDLRSTNVPFKSTFTFSSAVPPFLRPKLDWLAIRQLSAVSGSASIVRAKPRVFSRRVSDHDFVMCELEL